ncbi:MAG: GNAT family N-acetyltransferase [Bacteroidaceae bacterium]|nr:GNAT family N-acetyltransferase [Bacteroidaceae bacterium]
MNGVWLENERIVLRAPEPEDLELMYRMENDTSLWSVGDTLLPYSRYTLRTYLEQSKQDIFAERQARFVIALRSGDAVGMIDLANYDPLNSRAEVCIGLLGEFRGQGIASAALCLLCDYAFRRLHIHQLYAYIAIENGDSRKLFAGNGFVEALILKDWLRSENGYTDVVLAQKIAEL